MYLSLSLAQIAQNLASFSKQTPLWEAVGQMPGGDRPADSVCSYASVHDTLSAKTKSYAEKYQQHVIDYVVEWEKAVTTRIDTGLKKAEESRRDLDHYQKKVEAMRLTVNKALAQGKSVKSDNAEKLKRNEEKLIAAKQTYNKITSSLCILMEEVTERSWRDLHPLLIKVAQFDMTLAGDESRILANLQQAVNALKTVGAQSGISPQHRLKDLASLNPELLTTRPGGISGLSIEAAPNGMASSPMHSLSPLSSFDPMALPPGSVGAQGMGGFPVMVASNNNNSPMGSSLSLFSGAAAPAPTLEDVYSSSFGSGGYRSAPVSGNLPPLAPSSTTNATRSASLTDYDSRNGHVGPRSSSFSDFDRAGSSPYNNYPSSHHQQIMMPPPPMAPPPPPPDYSQYGGVMTISTSGSYPSDGLSLSSYGSSYPSSPAMYQQQQPNVASPYAVTTSSSAPNRTNPFGY
jgi:hypothetical protein